MKIRYFGAVAALALFGLMGPSNAHQHTRGLMKLDIGVERPEPEHSLGGPVVVCYDFTFKLGRDSDGIFPRYEQIEIKSRGEVSPDGSESSTFVISIPPLSFREGPSGFFMTWNPPNLKIRQHYGTYVWDFADAAYIENSRGVESFWGWIHQRDIDEWMSMRIKMRLYDSRPREERLPHFLELLFGAPTLRIGNDEWKSYLYSRNLAKGPCSGFLSARWIEHDS